MVLLFALLTISIDYPLDGSIFPPEIAPPTFLFRDPDSRARSWKIEVTFADGSAPLRAAARGERLRIGPIDPDCVSPTNEPPRLTPEQAAARTWTPPAALWETIKRRSVESPATIVIRGLGGSSGRVTLRTSRDPVGAPVFYRDVPLMPTPTETGSIKPLAPQALPLVRWRLRNVGETRSRVVMEGLPVCANCHSFSADGKTLGMDLDGLQNNKGRYILSPLDPETSIRRQDVIQWSSGEGRLKGSVRVGFLSQVSPDGRYVMTTLNPAPAGRGQPEPPSNYYVTNYPDYKFLQVFYPTRGILSWFSRATGVLRPLPGADDPRYVQMGGVWSPDGQYVVFARAEAREPNPPGAPVARYANDPNERQIRFDLYRIPFNGGRGGVAEPLAGASRNGMSNTFPKVSPDGRWIVFVQARNGMLMRPDSQLYMVPAAGGAARRMNSNTARMNSWHSFSPNGRWLVFSSKARSPYTQMYLTHIDEEGNDSPAILIENSTAANRAVNLPEFVNLPAGGLRAVGGPALDYYKLFDRALYLQKQKRNEESAAAWRRVLEIAPEDALAHDNLGLVLALAGRRKEAAAHFQQASESKLRGALEEEPDSAWARSSLGVLLLRSGRLEEALAHFEKAVALQPQSAAARSNLGAALARKGRLEEALAELRKALEADPAHAPAYHELGVLHQQRGEAEEALRQWRKALEADPRFPEAHTRLAQALSARGDAARALAHWRQAVLLQPENAAALRQTAWLLATSPDPGLRNGREAAALAVRALQLTTGQDPAVLDALAAAYAECGRFADAAATLRRALALPGEMEAPALRRRLALFEAKTPYRDVP